MAKEFKISTLRLKELEQELFYRPDMVHRLELIRSHLPR